MSLGQSRIIAISKPACMRAARSAIDIARRDCGDTTDISRFPPPFDPILTLLRVFRSTRGGCVRGVLVWDALRNRDNRRN